MHKTMNQGRMQTPLLSSMTELFGLLVDMHSAIDKSVKTNNFLKSALLEMINIDANLSCHADNSRYSYNLAKPKTP